MGERTKIPCHLMKRDSIGACSDLVSKLVMSSNVANRRWCSFLSMVFLAEFLSNVILVSDTECKVETMIDVSAVLCSGST